MTTLLIARRIVRLAVAAVALLVLPACYTLFKHPRLASLDYNRPDDRCVSCHTSDDIWRFVHLDGTPQMSADWKAYHSVPWWFDQRHTWSDSTGTRSDNKDSRR